ncbi:hypothetical protein M2164_000115 [Streptomyces sp. SAI-208]|uniref:hypothetical protein n=1 Tax=Streptomyces sp. SAI-208 TaxID=2940550 RepID=UPI002473D6E9|nr:hypothetical protein [Streptomyces sp. SAI-208]MDH6604480.1 hypothetical protein [Streptomyces sp. SAI-208]
MTHRFETAGLVLGPVEGRAASLCRFAGRTGAGHSTTALAVVDKALGIAERVADVDDVRQLLRLWDAALTWGHPDRPMVVRPSLGKANTTVLADLQNVLEQLPPQHLREVGVALSVSCGMVGLALELVEEAAAGRRESRTMSVDEAVTESLLNDDRIGDAVDVLLLESPHDWPPLQRAALTLALVWDLAGLIAYAARLSEENTLPTSLLWQAPGADHMCASARVPVPGTDLKVWAKVDPEPFDGRPLWGQAETISQWRWSLNWEDEDGLKVHYKTRCSPSQSAARWEAQRAAQKLLNDPHRAKSPWGEPLITPR